MRMIPNAPRETATATAMKSCRKPSTDQCPIHGIANFSSNNAPYASRYTEARITKPQNVKKCARPGTDHFRSLRWPNTSRTCAKTRAPRSSDRLVSGWPALISRYRKATRLPATARPTTVMSRPRMRRTSTSPPRRDGRTGSVRAGVVPARLARVPHLRDPPVFPVQIEVGRSADAEGLVGPWPAPAGFVLLGRAAEVGAPQHAPPRPAAAERAAAEAVQQHQV